MAKRRKLADLRNLLHESPRDLFVKLPTLRHHDLESLIDEPEFGIIMSNKTPRLLSTWRAIFQKWHSSQIAILMPFFEYTNGLNTLLHAAIRSNSKSNLRLYIGALEDADIFMGESNTRAAFRATVDYQNSAAFFIENYEPFITDLIVGYIVDPDLPPLPLAELSVEQRIEFVLNQLMDPTTMTPVVDDGFMEAMEIWASYTKKPRCYPTFGEAKGAGVLRHSIYAELELLQFQPIGQFVTVSDKWTRGDADRFGYLMAMSFVFGIKLGVKFDPVSSSVCTHGTDDLLAHFEFDHERTSAIVKAYSRYGYGLMNNRLDILDTLDMVRDAFLAAIGGIAQQYLSAVEIWKAVFEIADVSTDEFMEKVVCDSEEAKQHLREYVSTHDIRQLCWFWTGSSNLPDELCFELVNDRKLPTASTCINTVTMGSYANFGDFAEQFDMAVGNCVNSPFQKL